LIVGFASIVALNSSLKTAHSKTAGKLSACAGGTRNERLGQGSLETPGNGVSVEERPMNLLFIGCVAVVIAYFAAVGYYLFSTRERGEEYEPQ
jgi:hypothetical protein